MIWGRHDIAQIVKTRMDQSFRVSMNLLPRLATQC